MTKRIDRKTSSPDEGTMSASSLAAVMDAPIGVEIRSKPALPSRKSKATSAVIGPKRFLTAQLDDHIVNRQAELFYLQKQIQVQTQMVFVLEDGARVQGVVEWYDRHSIKVRGKSRVLIYKSAIKYLYKAGEVGTAPTE